MKCWPSWLPPDELRVGLAFSTTADPAPAGCSLDDDGVQLGIAESAMRRMRQTGLIWLEGKGLTQGTADMHLGPSTPASLAAFRIYVCQGFRGLSAAVGRACDSPADLSHQPTRCNQPTFESASRLNVQLNPATNFCLSVHQAYGSTVVCLSVLVARTRAAPVKGICPPTVQDNRQGTMVAPSAWQ